jgi:dimethylamine monooxygenase subunit A
VTAPAWLDELPLEPGPPWHSMGTRALAGPTATGADGGDDVGEQLAVKRRLLVESRHLVSARIERADVVAAEEEVAAGLVAGRAPAALPSVNPPWTALEAAAASVPDDLCLLVDRDGRWRLDSGVVCFPSLWRLSDKIGRPLAEIHEPVPAYADELADRVDRLVARLRADRPVWRRNWFVHPDPELHQPVPGRPPDPRPAPPEGLWLRSERQTLRRLPETGAVLFTIRTQQVTLAAVVDRPDIARSMADVIEAWPEPIVRYRGAAPWRRAVVAWLRSLG